MEVQNCMHSISIYTPFSALGSAIKTGTFISSLPQPALCYDLHNLRSSMEPSSNHTVNWSNILNDIKLNIGLNEESLKTSRISKLNNMAGWEMDELGREQNYQKNKTSSE